MTALAMTATSSFPVLSVLLLAVGALIIGIGCWYPIPSGRHTPAALRHRLDHQTRFVRRQLRCPAHTSPRYAYYPRRCPFPEPGSE